MTNVIFEIKTNKKPPFELVVEQKIKRYIVILGREYDKIKFPENYKIYIYP